jgi:hypothetical protein
LGVESKSVVVILGQAVHETGFGHGVIGSRKVGEREQFSVAAQLDQPVSNGFHTRPGNTQIGFDVADVAHGGRNHILAFLGKVILSHPPTVMLATHQRELNAMELQRLEIG